MRHGGPMLRTTTPWTAAISPYQGVKWDVKMGYSHVNLDGDGFQASRSEEWNYNTIHGQNTVTGQTQPQPDPLV